jgi:hypothetical protein
LARFGRRSIWRTASYERKPTAPAVKGGRPGKRAALWPLSARRRMVKLGDALAFSDGDFAPASDDALEGGEADEGVAADLLAALDRLEEETLALRPGGAEEGGNRGFEIGRQRAAYGNEGVLFGEREKLFAAGLDGMGGGFHFKPV